MKLKATEALYEGKVLKPEMVDGLRMNTITPDSLVATATWEGWCCDDV